MKVMRPWLVAPRTVEYREEEITLTRSTLLVRHVCTAPSQGTAIHRYRGEEIGLDQYSRKESGGPFPYNWLQGFAYGVGRVEEVGADVKGFTPGQLVYCEKLTAELSVVTPNDVIPLPEGVHPEDAAMLQKAGVGLHGARAANVILGDTALVTGQGPIGCFAAQLCKLAGAYQVIATDLADGRLEVAKQAGIDVVLNPRRDDVVKRVQELTNGLGADVVIEASGSPKAFLQACAAARFYTKIVVLGWILDSCTFNMSDAFTPKGLEMVVCHSGQPGDWRLLRRANRQVKPGELGRMDNIYMMNLMAQDKLLSKEMISHRFPLKDLVKVWAEFIDQKPDEYVQVLFVS
jgi:threonine dehydrogenase-like Zn-dependent dehydrogenase